MEVALTLPDQQDIFTNMRFWFDFLVRNRFVSAGYIWICSGHSHYTELYFLLYFSAEKHYQRKKPATTSSLFLSCKIVGLQHTSTSRALTAVIALLQTARSIQKIPGPSLGGLNSDIQTWASSIRKYDCLGLVVTFKFCLGLVGIGFTFSLNQIPFRQRKKPEVYA